MLIIGIMCASLIQILDTTIANVAIPHMQNSLGATADNITWVLTSYILASAVAMPITGWLADRFGARRLLILSTMFFIIASMLCGAAQNLEQMVFFRTLQGIAGAFIMPLGQSFLLDTTRPSRHPQIMAIWGMGVMIGPILGPLLGGWLTESANWRWVFYVNLPIGLVALALLIANLPQRDTIKRPFDMFGFAMIAIALTSLQLLLDRGMQIDWYDSYEAWIYTLLFLSTGWMAIIHLATARHPLFSSSLFKDRNYTIALSFMIAIGVIMFATMALMPPMLQRLFGYDVIDTGIVLMPRGVGVLLSMQLSGVLIRFGFDSRKIIATGFALGAISLWQMAHWSLDVDQYHIVMSGFLQGLGLGLVFIPLNVSAYTTLDPRLRTDGSSLLNLNRSLGGSIGISLTSVLLGANIQTLHNELGSHVTANMSGVIDVSTIDRYQALGDAALRMIDAEVNRQAAMIAYIDNFYVMMWLCIAAIPFSLFMRRNTGSRGAASADAAPH